MPLYRRLRAKSLVEQNGPSVGCPKPSGKTAKQNRTARFTKTTGSTQFGRLCVKPARAKNANVSHKTPENIFVAVFVAGFVAGFVAEPEIFVAGPRETKN